MGRRPLAVNGLIGIAIAVALLVGTLEGAGHIRRECFRRFAVVRSPLSTSVTWSPRRARTAARAPSGHLMTDRTVWTTGSSATA